MEVHKNPLVGSLVGTKTYDIDSYKLPAWIPFFPVPKNFEKYLSYRPRLDNYKTQLKKQQNWSSHSRVLRIATHSCHSCLFISMKWNLNFLVIILLTLILFLLLTATDTRESTKPRHDTTGTHHHAAGHHSDAKLTVAVTNRSAHGCTDEPKQWSTTPAEHTKRNAATSIPSPTTSAASEKSGCAAE